jgi:hypothetical protein
MVGVASIAIGGVLIDVLMLRWDYSISPSSPSKLYRSLVDSDNLSFCLLSSTRMRFLVSLILAVNPLVAVDNLYCSLVWKPLQQIGF